MKGLKQKLEEKSMLIQTFVFDDESDKSQIQKQWFDEVEQPKVRVVMPLLCKEFVASPHACLLLQLGQATPNVRFLPVVANFKSLNDALDLTDDFFKAQYGYDGDLSEDILRCLRDEKKVSAWSGKTPVHSEADEAESGVSDAHIQRLNSFPGMVQAVSGVRGLKRCLPFIKSVLNTANRVPASSDFDTDVHVEAIISQTCKTC